MSEYIVGAKGTMVAATIMGGLLALPYLKMTPTQKMLSVPSAVFMSYQFSAPIAEWVGLAEGAVGALMGLFGMAICHLIFDSLQKSDLSIKVADIIELIRSRRE